MNEQGIMPVTIPEESFKAYLFKNRRNRNMLWLAAVVAIIQFWIFKYIYPTIHFVAPDTFGYLTVTQQHLDLSPNGIGYSSFLRLFGMFSSSDTALAAFQYLLIQSSALWFLFTLFYFYRPGKVVQAILLGFIVLNPLCLSLANLVSGDGIFVAVSLVWVASLLWIVHRPTMGVVIWHALALVIALAIRYNAIIYPVITVFAFILSRQPVYRKLMGLGICLLLCGLSIVYTSSHYKRLTGYSQYAPLSGWIMASNVLYAYRYVDSIDRKPVNTRFEVLDTMVRTYFDISRGTKDYPMDLIMYTRPSGIPLFRYMYFQFKGELSAYELQQWATVAPLYRKYGNYTAQQYPLQYARHILWPNVNKYYAPFAESLGTYSSGSSTMEPIERKWLGYNSERSVARTKGVEIISLGFYQTFLGIVNMLMLGGILGFGMLKGFEIRTLFRKGALLAGVIWLLNAGFVVFASYSYLHFQAFPLLFTTAFSILLVEWLWKMGGRAERNRSLITEETRGLLAKDGFPEQVISS